MFGIIGKPSGYTINRYALELDGGKSLDSLLAVEGASFKSDAITSLVGANNQITRYPGRPKIDEFTISCGMAMSSSFWDWIKDSLENNPSRRTGAIVGYDQGWVERSRRTFDHALIAEVQFPALDGSQSSIAMLKVKISPESLTYKQSPQNIGQRPEEQKSRDWHANNFAFKVDRFGTQPLKAAVVGGFTVKQNIIDNPVGSDLLTVKSIGRLEMPTLQVTYNQIDAPGFMDWFDKSITKGNYLDQETTAHLTYLDPSLKKELMRLDFDQVGLLSVDMQGHEGGKKGLARIVTQFYCDSIKFNKGSGT